MNTVLMIFDVIKDVLDEPLLLRTRIYAAVKSKFDPLRATIELQGSRLFCLPRKASFRPMRTIAGNLWWFANVHFPEP